MKDIAVICLLLPNGELVLQRRDEAIEVSPGLLGFFGGHVEDGESADEAIRRELEEETSLRVHSLNIEFITKVDLRHPTNSNIPGYRRFHIYKSAIPDDKFQVFEGQYAESHTLADLRSRTDLAPSAHYIVNNINLF